MGVRKNQNAMSAAEWTAFINAIRGTHGTAAAPPAYRRFVTLHIDAMSPANMGWSVHSMRMGGPIMPGRNFLAWHRRLLKRFEERLQVVDASVTVPYWDSVTDRAIPAALNDPALLLELSITRAWNPSQLADPSDLNAANGFSGSFGGFQSFLEIEVHNGTHRAVGGDMAGPASPADPLFWLHHAFIDKVWADWQASPNGQDPPNTSEVLQPATLGPGQPFGVAVSSLLSIATLGYSYA